MPSVLKTQTHQEGETKLSKSQQDYDYEKEVFGSLGGKIISAVELMAILK